MSKFVAYTDENHGVFIVTQKNDPKFRERAALANSGIPSPDFMERREIDDLYVHIDPQLSFDVF